MGNTYKGCLTETDLFRSARACSDLALARWMGNHHATDTIRQPHTLHRRLPIRRELGGLLFDVHHRTDIPERADRGGLRRPCYHAHWLHGQQEGVYSGCETHVPVHVMHVDHGIPKANGGSDHLNNLQMPCSRRKVGMCIGTHEQLRAKLRLDTLIQ